MSTRDGLEHATSTTFYLSDIALHSPDICLGSI